MEDSFKVRVEKAFGSLPIPSSSLNSLWSLTQDEINDTPSSKRVHQSQSKPKPKPYSSSQFRVELENDLENLNNNDDEEDVRGPSKPPDYDDEQWEIRSGIGLDCTLDYEEEEDRYDKQAIGKENSGDRVYMKDINDDGVEMSSCSEIPTMFKDFMRDPRANHLAARIRLKQDDEAAKKIDALHVSEKSTPDTGGGGGGVINPKSILKNKENHPSETRSKKRVRFDSECDDRGNDDENEGTRDVRMKTPSMEEIAASNQLSKSQEFASAVPDYIRNPSRYTHYTFDSTSDMDDKSNTEAYMSFLECLKGSNAAATGTGSHADDALDHPSVTFIPKKKSGDDATTGENEMVSKQKLDVDKEPMNKRAFTVRIAAGDTQNNDVCAMEEDEPEVTEDTKKGLPRLNRQFRKKTQEDLEEPIV
ncbi:uncharacterized protein LOC133305720 [Gastrolobium bilobum]|uniref:uncharacterized protein LOC133305720 n=1 Tax=Gastrolobium bilobum TaxID=150636 RepID=UPI002AAF0F78|nr:uncharacterized protein LOC133305720 [Gastrolobium bilobum]